MRLKNSIIKIAESLLGINIYQFRYNDNKDDIYQGVMAQELLGTKFESSVKLFEDGYYGVDYSQIDVEFKKL